jgi:nuclear fusion protein
MTTTITVERLTTLTTILEATRTAIVQGVLDVTVTQASSTVQHENSSQFGITLANKDVSSSVMTNPTTISTIHSSSTSTAVSSVAASISTHDGQMQNGLFQVTTSGKNSNIGLVIGIPVAVIGLALIVVATWFYFHQKKQKDSASCAKLESYYDDKFNYKVGTGEDGFSPYKMRSVYQVRAKAQSTDHLGSFGQPSFQQNNESEYSLKEPGQGPADSKWNLNTPLSKWFAKHSNVSSATSRGSLSTGPFSPIVALKEFKLNRSNRSEINEKSPILPTFPQATYHPHSYDSAQKSVSSNETDVSKQEIPVNLIGKVSVPKLQPVSDKKKRQNSKSKKLYESKPLPNKPYSISGSPKTLEGLEQRVYERVIPTTPVVDLAKYKNDDIYKVITDYTKNLADELTIKEGGYVKILAVHTDGWCLVEKVDSKGNILVQSDGYINEGRGVVPKMCLDTTS